MTITRNVNGTMTFSVSYSARMINDPNGIIADVREGLEGVKYDTIVGRGTSGMLIVPIVARALRKNYFIIRKDEERAVSHSDATPYMGVLGKRWLFLDDFCSTGQTFRVVRNAIKDAERQVNEMRQYRTNPNKRDIYGLPVMETFPYDDQFATELVGYYEYNKMMAEGNSGFTPWNDDPNLAKGGWWDDAPFAVAEREKYKASLPVPIEPDFDTTVVETPTKFVCDIQGCACGFTPDRPDIKIEVRA